MGDGLTADQERLLEGLLDVVVPPSADGRLPGAGALGLVAHVVRTMERTPMLRPVVEHGLGAIAELATKRTAGGWAALSADERRAVFAELAATDQLFQPALFFLVYSGYYQHPRVLEALGLEPRPPHPRGYEMEPDDLSLLERVRRRGPLYRT